MWPFICYEKNIGIILDLSIRDQTFIVKKQLYSMNNYYLRSNSKIYLITLNYN